MGAVSGQRPGQGSSTLSVHGRPPQETLNSGPEPFQPESCTPLTKNPADSMLDESAGPEQKRPL